MRHGARLVVCFGLTAVGGLAQTKFDSASIMLHPNCTVQGGMPPSGRLRMLCTTARNLVMAAYSEGATAQRLSVVGGPGWIDSETYDVEARAENGKAPPSEMYGPMLRVLIEDRLKVKVHKEVRDVPIYSLAVGKSGPKLQRANEGSCIVFNIDHPPAMPAAGQPLPVICGRIPISTSGTRTIVDAYAITLPRFAGRALLGTVDRPVFDKTGLEGMFNIHLEFSKDDTDLSAPSIYTAIQDQLGLKLLPDTGPMEVLVLDQIERPSEN